jgi:recombination protein RecA
VAPPFKTAEFDILFDEGISTEGCILDLGVNLGLVSKSGAFYTYNDSRIGQGRENAREYLKEHKEIAKEIEQQIRAQAFSIPVTTSSDAVE